MMQRVMRGGGTLAAGLLTLFGLIHVWWAVCGMSAGSAVIPVRDGRPVFRPSRLGTLGVAGCLFAGALTLLARLGLVRVPGLVSGVLPARLGASLPHRGAWSLAVLFGLRAVGDFRYVGVFKRVTGTRFARWDTRLFVPLCVVVSAGSALAAVSEPTLDVTSGKLPMRSLRAVQVASRLSQRRVPAAPVSRSRTLKPAVLSRASISDPR